jgi:hypothetical protein
LITGGSAIAFAAHHSPSAAVALFCAASVRSKRVRPGAVQPGSQTEAGSQIAASSRARAYSG